ncbi:MAG TPA: bifunctional DedA family/phosphatase PAP2 family protein [Roseiflexaceae bacterium]|nr:bifunctional DedA family/phosphatase PAP2 family protein [Roseiflexaceae bacterium]
MLQNLNQLVITYGYIMVALLILVESAGLPLPGESALLLAAAYAGAGHLSIVGVIAAAAVAAVLGDTIGYWFGRRGGRPLVERYGHWFRMDESKLQWIEGFFAKHGPKTVFFGRFVGVLRTYSALFAGISHMPYGTFLRYNAAGGMLWAVLFGMLGYLFGQYLGVVEQVVRDAGWIIVGLVAIVVVAGLVWRWVARHQDRIIAAWQRVESYPAVARGRARYAPQLRWLRHRLTPGQYLGLHLTLGLLAAVLFLWLLGGVTQDVVAHDPLTRFDQHLAAMLHGWATPTATTVAVIISAFGEPVVVVLAVVVAVLYILRRQWLHVGTWLIALAGAEVINQTIKYIVARPRPIFFHPLIPETGYSFPSGHVLFSVVAYGLLAYFAVLILRTWKLRTAVICAAAALVVLIGFCRLYLGVHYFSDVVGGVAAGGVWLSTCITGMELVRRGEINSSWTRRLQEWSRQFVA